MPGASPIWKLGETWSTAGQTSAGEGELLEQTASPESVSIHYGLEGARRARGTAVICDVFRFSTTVTTLLGRGAARVVVAPSADALESVLRKVSRPLVFSELNLSLPLGTERFDNSPTAVLGANLQNRTAVSVTTSGSRVLSEAARMADEVLVGGFANAGALTSYLMSRAPAHITLLAAGLVTSGGHRLEDDLCVAYLRDRLLVRDPDFSACRFRIITHPATQANLVECAATFVEDVHACLTLDSWHVVPRLDGNAVPPVLLAEPRSPASAPAGTGRKVVDLQVIVRAAPGQVWSALTRPESISVWWDEGVELDARPGGGFCEHWQDPTGQMRHTRGQVWVAQPGRRLALTWADEEWQGETLVILDLAPLEGGTSLRLRHSGWERLAPERAQEACGAHRAGWGELLSQLGAYVERHVGSEVDGGPGS